MHLLDSYNPALLRAVHSAVQAAKATTEHLPVCGLKELLVGWSSVTQTHSCARVDVADASICDQHLNGEVMKWLDQCHWALAAYAASSRLGVAADLKIKLEDVLHVHDNGDPSKPSRNDYLPSYYVALDHDERAMRIVIRGTSVLKDILADIQGSASPFCSGHAHTGMAQAARALVEEEMPRMQDVIKNYPGYSILFLGHSLGGGIAALAACLLNWDEQLSQQLQGTTVTAATFAAPPVLTRDLAHQSREFVKAIINNNDAIPRASMSSVVGLMHEIVAAKEHVKEEHKVASGVAEGVLGIGKGGQQIGQTITLALADNIEVAGKHLLGSLRRSAVQLKQEQQQQQQQQQQNTSTPSGFNRSSSSSFKSSFLSSLASATVSLIDKAVPTTAADAKAAESKKGQGATQASAQAAVSDTAPNDSAGENSSAQQSDRQPSSQQQLESNSSSSPQAEGLDQSAVSTSEAAEADLSSQAPLSAPPSTEPETSATAAASSECDPASSGSIAIQATSGEAGSQSDIAAGTVDLDGSCVPVDVETQQLFSKCADLEASENAAAVVPTSDPEQPTDASSSMPTEAQSPPLEPPAVDEQKQQKQPLVPLHIPGLLYYIHRNGNTSRLFKDVPASQFERLLITSNCLTDHGCSTYRTALAEVIFLISTMPV